MHDVMAAEQWDIVGVGHLAQDAFVPVEVDHGMGMPRELHVHAYHLSPGRTQPIDACLYRLAELVELCTTYRVRRPRFPEHQHRLQGDYLIQMGGYLLGRLTRHSAVRHRHMRSWETAGEGHSETRWPGKIRAAGRMPER